ncbi:Fatty acyl-CoA reductase 2 [Armadillidium vulgare]|nr:Fatty acyl-CoA reductase 2 [Armadillidium vulgare]
MVHVSTAFTNCNREDVREEIYPVNLEPYRLLSLSDWVDEDVLETISPRGKNDFKIFNLVSGADQPLTYRELRDFSVPALRKYPLTYPLWYPNISLIKCGYLAAFITLLIQVFPAVIIDKVMTTIGMKPRTMEESFNERSRRISLTSQEFLGINILRNIVWVVSNMLLRRIYQLCLRPDFK